MQTINCPNCQLVIAAPEIKVDILNGIDNSVVIYHHDQGITCNGCKMYMLPFVGSVSLGVGWKLSEKPEEPSRIISIGEMIAPRMIN